MSEFDILKGSQLRHQFPSPSGLKDSYLAELMLPEGSHARESDWTVFFLSEKDLKRPAVAGLPEVPGNDQLCVLNLVRTKMDRSVKRGAVVKSMAVATRHRFYNVFKPLLMLALDSVFECLESPEPVLQTLYNILNCELDLSALTPLSPLERRFLRSSRMRSSTPLSDAFTTSVKWGSAVLPFRIPHFLENDEVVEASVQTLVTRFQEGIMTIFNALLCEKRVLFLGYQQPASEVCSAVLSACLLVSPTLTGTLQRAFPYANLTNLDFLSVPGYLAGVTNPIFESRPQWWDLIGNLTTGEITLSAAYQEELNGACHHSMDSSFFTELMSGLKLKYGEEWCRCMFRDYCQHLVQLAHEEELFTDAAQRQAHLEANQVRINAFLKSRASQAYEKSSALRSSDSAFRELDGVMRHHVRTLQVKKPSAAEMIAIFTDFLRYVGQREEILEFLSFLPESQGGLFPVAVALFHKHTKVRSAAVELLKRIDALPEGQKSVSGLNYFLLLTLYREGKAGEAQQAAIPGNSALAPPAEEILEEGE